jgi:hypothetical protein
MDAERLAQSAASGGLPGRYTATRHRLHEQCVDQVPGHERELQLVPANNIVDDDVGGAVVARFGPDPRNRASLLQHDLVHVQPVGPRGNPRHVASRGTASISLISPSGLDKGVSTPILCAYTRMAGHLEHPQRQVAPPSTRCNCAVLREAACYVTQLYDLHLAAADLLSTQFSILTRLKELGPTTINALAQALVMDRTTVGRNTSCGCSGDA